MQLKISITKETLRSTCNCSQDHGRNCAIAHEVRKIFPFAEVGEESIYFYSEDATMIRSVACLPIEAINFINEFDSLGPVKRMGMEPLSFEITVPERVVNEIDIKEVKEILEGCSNLQLV